MEPFCILTNTIHCYNVLNYWIDQYIALLSNIITHMSYKNLIVSLAVVAAVAFPVAAFADAPVAGNDASSATVSAPASGNVDSSAASAPVSGGSSSSADVAPASGSSDSSAASVPSTGGAVSSAGSSSGSSSSGGSPVITGGSSGSTSSSGSSIGGGSIVVGISASTSTCPLISSYMKMGIVNNSADVAKLQGFLKNNQGLNVAVTGIFDTKTEAAVEAFQKKYLSDILGPWGATKATGAVYITTLKKINQLACAQPLSLSAAEISIINAYKAKVANTQVSAPATNTDAVTAPVTSPTGPVGPTMDNTVGSGADQSANTAAVGNTSILGKFWNFLKNLF